MDDKDERPQQEEEKGGEPARADDAIDDLELVKEEGGAVKGGQRPRYADATSP